MLQAFLAGTPVETRGFEREALYRRMSDVDLWSAFLSRCEHLTEIAAAAAPFFAEHMREERILHRWDLTGDDRSSVQSLTEPWMTEHSVVSVGRPLLVKGHAGLDLGPKSASRAACAHRAPTTSW
ncbi:hypothetical protein [Streptomyces sp. PanSC9]|uniref:hypothetical protein n=1 Tax=Streptomyces sp. PanSC9 TaxID=1520461 RepID=UPI000F481585|nr:hypothetical protein [Streptomyces sp. PanSC9]